MNRPTLASTEKFTPYNHSPYMVKSWAVITLASKLHEMLLKLWVVHIGVNKTQIAQRSVVKSVKFKAGFAHRGFAFTSWSVGVFSRGLSDSKTYLVSLGTVVGQLGFSFFR